MSKRELVISEEGDRPSAPRPCVLLSFPGCYYGQFPNQLTSQCQHHLRQPDHSHGADSQDGLKKSLLELMGEVARMEKLSNDELSSHLLWDRDHYVRFVSGNSPGETARLGQCTSVPNCHDSSAWRSYQERDVAFVSWERLPGGQLPISPLPSLVPNFVIEILSKGNTYGEMSRKRREYFHAGVELMWKVDHRDRTITVYRTSQRFEVIREGAMIDGVPVLPEWTFNTADLFAVLDQQPPTAP